MTDQPTAQPQTPKYTLTFTNGALAKLKDLATKLGVSEDNLSEVVVKGMKVLDLANDGKLVVDKGEEKLEIDLKSL